VVDWLAGAEANEVALTKSWYSVLRTVESRIRTTEFQCPILWVTFTSRYARSIQLHASRREDYFPEVKLVFAAKGASYRSYGLRRQGYESDNIFGI
jgi:hypothetical protein